MFKAGLLIALLLVCAAPANAAPDDWASVRGTIACKWMDLHPDLYGSLSTMRTMQDEGVPVQEIPATLAEVISHYCPNHADLFNKTRQYLTHGGGVAVVGGGM